MQKMSNSKNFEHIIQLWLYGCALLIFIMIIIGGLTRLTNSGLSITEWKPVTGVIFPFTESAWQIEFDKYKQSPEFIHVNFMISLSEFKFIYFLEYFHRLFGRLIGLFFFIPLIYFSLKGLIPRKLKLNLLAIFVLGAAQGFLGWYMVKSGLVDDPAVSHYRLTMHLSMAIIILSLILLNAWSFSKINKLPDRNLLKFSGFITIYLFVQIMLGGLVAGLDAGLIYNNFPYMGNYIFPPELVDESYVLASPIKVQFIHRYVGLFSAILILMYYLKVKSLTSYSYLKISSNLLIFFVLLQIGLGIATLRFNVPISFASAHQAMAVLLFCTSMYQTYYFKRA